MHYAPTHIKLNGVDQFIDRCFSIAWKLFFLLLLLQEKKKEAKYDCLHTRDLPFLFNLFYRLFILLKKKFSFPVIINFQWTIEWINKLFHSYSTMRVDFGKRTKKIISNWNHSFSNYKTMNKILNKFRKNKNCKKNI